MDDSKVDIKIISFGFKNGVPVDVNVIADARTELSNPWQYPNLRSQTGLDQEVQEKVRGERRYKPYLEKLKSRLRREIGYRNRKGRIDKKIVFGVGCHGGKHRSVVLAEDLVDFCCDRADVHRITLEHRELS